MAIFFKFFFFKLTFLNFFFKVYSYISIPKNFINILIYYCNLWFYYYIPAKNNKLNYFFFFKKLNIDINIINLTRIFNPLYKLHKFFLYPFYYFKILLNGLGYKFFFYKKFIYILIGLSHYILFKISMNIYIKCRKKKVFLVSTNNLELFNLYYKLLQIQKLNIYKIKGLYFFKLFILKKYIFFKKGKKQQFM